MRQEGSAYEKGRLARQSPPQAQSHCQNGWFSSAPPWPDLMLADTCHRADQNRPPVGTSKPASLRRKIHNSFLITGSGKLAFRNGIVYRSEEHTSELQSPCNLVC